MPLVIDDPEAESLARELAEYAGESVTQAVIVALRERFERKIRRRQPGTDAPNVAEALLRIGRECANLPVLDPRTADDILGYDENGLPT